MRGSLLLALLLGLAAAAGLVGCPASMGDDDDATDDDDSAAGDDDDATDDDDAADDDDSADAGISAVTFAASMQGLDTGWPEDDGAVTQLSGTFHFVYWDSLEDQDLNCRQRFDFSATAQFGDALVLECGSCIGQVLVMSVQALDPDEFEDSCPPLPPEVDLSFLLRPGDITDPADFRSLILLSVADLLALDWQLGVGGLAVAKLAEFYAAVGLEVLHIAFVTPAGWLDDEASLAAVASAWSDGGLLPMFVVYADASDEDGDPALVGESFLASLWTVRVGSGVDVLP